MRGHDRCTRADLIKVLQGRTMLLPGLDDQHQWHRTMRRRYKLDDNNVIVAKQTNRRLIFKYEEEKTVAMFIGLAMQAVGGLLTMHAVGGLPEPAPPPPIHSPAATDLGLLRRQYNRMHCPSVTKRQFLCYCCALGGAIQVAACEACDGERERERERERKKTALAGQQDHQGQGSKEDGKAVSQRVAAAEGGGGCQQPPGKHQACRCYQWLT